MEKKSSNWHFPADLGCMLFSWLWFGAIAIVSGGILPLIIRLRSGDVLQIFYVALGLAALGTVLLFSARLPLYRQRRFWVVGPRELDRFHRRLYWLAYAFVLGGLGLLLVVWSRLR